MPWTNPKHYRFDLHNVASFAPSQPGVYGFYARDGWVYFGESQDIQRRLLEHLRDSTHCIHQFAPMHFSFEERPDRQDRMTELLTEFAPPCNVRTPPDAGKPKGSALNK